MRVLVVEDNTKLAGLLREGLVRDGHAVDLCHDGGSAIEFASSSAYDAIVLDLMLPGIDGFGVLKALRGSQTRTPVLMLTARGEVEDRIAGLDHGADDYMVKPFAFDELFARLRALVRRANRTSDSVLRVNDLEVDTVAKVARRGGRIIELSRREYALLECLALRKGRVVSRDALRDSVYDLDADVASNVIDVYVGHLRRKIDRDFAEKLLHTRRGLGYLLGEVE
jgi:two-component system OmpR family response regulator